MNSSAGEAADPDGDPVVLVAWSLDRDRDCAKGLGCCADGGRHLSSVTLRQDAPRTVGVRSVNLEGDKAHRNLRKFLPRGRAEHDRLTVERSTSQHSSPSKWVSVVISERYAMSNGSASSRHGDGHGGDAC